MTHAAHEIRDHLAREERDREAGIAGDEWSRRAMRMMRRVERCRQSTARLERVADGQRQAMMMPLPCGSRLCADCGARLRAATRERIIEGDPVDPDFSWRTVITLTMRTWDVDPAWAWSRMGSWISRFIASMRKWERRNRPWMRDFSHEYAWVIEKTRLGWPHVHIILARPCGSSGAESQLHQWACDMWEKITNCYVSRKFVRKRDGLLHGVGVDIQPVQDPARAAGYVAKYMSKAVLDPWHYAILGRKRVWSTSKGIPAARRQTSGWRLERVLTEDDDPCRRPEAWADMADGGWTPVWETDSGVALWVRREPDIVPDRPWMDEALGDVDWTGPPDTGYARKRAQAETTI